MNNLPPKLVTFDGEARSGKGTIVQFTKDFLRDEYAKKVMLIDAGQVFRVLVVSATQAGVDMDDPSAIDGFLASERQIKACAQLVKQVYHMPKSQRDALLYTNQVGRDSAKIGASPLSQSFKDDLLRKWLADARIEGFEVVLLDGRALEEVGKALESEGLCQFVAGLYFTCHPEVGARRTLGFAKLGYQDLAPADKLTVDQLMSQISERNQKDAQRQVQPIKPPLRASIWRLPEAAPTLSPIMQPAMLIVDTGADMTKRQMSLPIAEFVVSQLDNS